MGILSRLLRTEVNQTRADMDNSLVSSKKKPVSFAPFRKVEPTTVKKEMIEPALFRRPAQRNEAIDLPEEKEVLSTAKRSRLLTQPERQTRESSNNDLMQGRVVKKGTTILTPYKKEMEPMKEVKPSSIEERKGKKDDLLEEKKEIVERSELLEDPLEEHRRVMNENIDTMRNLEEKVFDLMNRLDDLPNAHVLWESLKKEQ